jgi:hypothetical protein
VDEEPGEGHLVQCGECAEQDGNATVAEEAAEEEVLRGGRLVRVKYASEV